MEDLTDRKYDMLKVMTLDEAIEKEKRYAEIKERQAEEPRRLFVDDDREKEYRAVIAKEDAEARKRAEWLEELKSYRASVFSGDMTQKMLKEEYCKAVDDFAESVKNLIADSSVIRFKDIDEIAEQLKVGGENDRAGTESN